MFASLVMLIAALAVIAFNYGSTDKMALADRIGFSLVIFGFLTLPLTSILLFVPSIFLILIGLVPIVFINTDKYYEARNALRQVWAGNATETKRNPFNLVLLGLAICVVGAFTFRISYQHSVAPAKEKILATHTGVNEITLAKSGFPDGGRPLPVMGLVYEIQSGYSRIVLNGETHQREGVGGRFVRKGVEPTRFLIEETLYSKEGLFGPLQYEALRIIDTKDGGTIATKEWRCQYDDCDISADDDLNGQNSQAARFVRKVLVPMVDQSSIEYPNTVDTAKAISPSTSLTKEQLLNRAVGCPKTISVPIRRDINEFVVSTSEWTFISRNSIQQIQCLPIGILAMSGLHSAHNFDLISYDGKLLRQFSWQGPQGVFLGNVSQHLSGAIVSNGSIQFRVLYYADRFPRGDESNVGDMEYQLEFDLAKSR